MVENTQDLGAWGDDSQEIKTAPISPWGDVADINAKNRFPVQLARTVNRREKEPTAEQTGTAAFVLVSTTQLRALNTQGRTTDRLFHKGQCRLTGRLHFLTATGSSSLFEEVAGDHSALFARLAALGMDTLPMAIYVAAASPASLSYYPNGSATDEGMREIPLGVGLVEEIAIADSIEQTYNAELITPANTGPYKIWTDSDKGWPIKEAEQGIQQLVRIGLQDRFPWCSVRAEQPGKEGRTDLEIVDVRTGLPGEVTHHAVLEMKVLRSRGSTGDAVAPAAIAVHIEDGVDQARVYGESKNTLLQMLCCFDMRDTDIGCTATFAHVNEKATKLDVRLHRWFLYRSAEALRSARTGRSGGASASGP